MITQDTREVHKHQYVFKDKTESIQNSARVRFNMAPKEKAIEIVTNRETMPETNDFDDDGLCQVCFSENANSVLLDCGHGSVCLQCAIDSMKKNNSCIFCRAKVTQIIEIDIAEVRKGLYKVLNSFYVSDDQ